MTKTYLFYDLETTGLNKCFDQIIQFAAIRTDLELNELTRHEYYVKLNPDVIPTPKAFITHRISPQKLAQGLSEVEALKKIHQLVNEPGTISLGYNTLGFDDEFLRFSFYRNLLPPYHHQFANDCSRMDLYPMTVMYSLFHKDLLKWPATNLKLETICLNNNLMSGAAHNAMTDVVATLNLARTLRKEMKTWHYLQGFFNKQTDQERCYQVTTPASHDLPTAILIDGKFGINQHFQCAVTPLGQHNHYKNQSLWLRVDHDLLQKANLENFVDHTWVINKKMGEPGMILPMKDRFLQPYLKSKQNEIAANLEWLKESKHLLETITSHYRNYTYPKIPDIDAAASLYENGFITPHDQETCLKFHDADPTKKMTLVSSFIAKPLRELAIRLLGHHHPLSLDDEARDYYDQFLKNIANGCYNTADYSGKARLSPSQALQEIKELLLTELDEQQKTILQELTSYINQQFKPTTN